jgi:hypothetical protein
MPSQKLQLGCRGWDVVLYDPPRRDDGAAGIWYMGLMSDVGHQHAARGAGAPVPRAACWQYFNRIGSRYGGVCVRACGGGGSSACTSLRTLRSALHSRHATCDMRHARPRMPVSLWRISHFLLDVQHPVQRGTATQPHAQPRAPPGNAPTLPFPCCCCCCSCCTSDS